MHPTKHTVTALLGALALVLVPAMLYAQATLTPPTVTSHTNGQSVSNSFVTLRGTATASSTVFVRSPRTATSTIANGNGTWSAGVLLPSGTSLISMSLRDNTGAISPTTTISLVLAQDVIPPQEPTINTPTNGNPVTGTAEPGATVVVQTASGSSCQAIADQNGNWSCVLNPLPVNGESISAGSRDGSGNTSPIRQIAEGILSQVIDSVGDSSSGFLRDGIFGCQAGAYAQGVGTLSAIGGVYVPVNDAAVTQNTGYLIYKECTLDGVISAMKEGATAGFVKSILHFANTGDNGNPQFVSNLAAHLQDVADRVTLEFTKEYYTGKMCSTLRQSVRAQVVRQYLATRNNPGNTVQCTLSSVADGQYDARRFFETVLNPANYPVGATTLARLELQEKIDREEELEIIRLNWGNGFKDITETVETPTESGDPIVGRRTLTPGYLVSQAIAQASGSGFRQLENATEVDQITSALFSGLTNQILTDIRGLSGLSESRSGQVPYLEQLSAEASSRVRQTATNAALQILNATLAAEVEYGNLKQEALTSITQARNQIIAAEARCWELIETAVRDRTSSSSLTIATSTTESSAVIAQNQLGTLESRIEQDVSNSQTALGLLQRLVTDVTNTASRSVQRTALERLDTLIANRAVHTAFDVKTAQQQTENVQTTMEALVEDTITAWGSGNGWCNVNNETVVSQWVDEWTN